jgi:multiple sugar transport system permease protein
MGWLNAAFLNLGWITNPILFLKDPQTFLACVMALAIWHGLAFTILLFLAGLQQIPTQLYKAAEIDGAGWWQKFWHVSLPGIRPQLFFALIMGLIGSFQVFEQIYMLGGGSGYAGSKFGPNDAGRTMVPLIYDLGFEQFKMGRASAVAYILFLVILVFTMLQLRVLRQKTAD